MFRITAAVVAIALAGLTITFAAPNEGADTQSADSTYSADLVVAGGCFWCVEADFEKLEGVGDVISGYSGGVLENPTYRNHEGHLEVAKIPYDPDVVTYRELVDYFFRHVDPLDDGGQFCDRGHSYSTAIFYNNAEEKEMAEAAKAEAESILGEPVVTPIRERMTFWIAEDYHQDYYKKSPIRYKYYRAACGRDRRVKSLWGK